MDNEFEDSMPPEPPRLVRTRAVREGFFEPNPRNIASATPYNDAENLRIARETADRLAAQREAEAAERRNAMQNGVNGGKRRKTHRRRKSHRRRTHRRRTHRRRSHRRH
jgi:hypothetical protein